MRARNTDCISHIRSMITPVKTASHKKIFHFSGARLR
jgi:hypothetical protein